MQVGDLVKWRKRRGKVDPGIRTGILLGKEPGHAHDGLDYYWRVFMEGQVICMDEAYLEVMHESR